MIDLTQLTSASRAEAIRQARRIASNRSREATEPAAAAWAALATGASRASDLRSALADAKATAARSLGSAGYLAEAVGVIASAGGSPRWLGKATELTAALDFALAAQVTAARAAEAARLRQRYGDRYNYLPTETY